MNRNLIIKFFVCMLAAAVLVGCGGTDTNSVPDQPDVIDSGKDSYVPDTQNEDADAGQEAGEDADSAVDEDVQVEPDSDAGDEPDAEQEAEAGEDAADAADEPDAGDEPDVVGDEPDANAEADTAEAPDAGEDASEADAQAEADSAPDADAAPEADAADEPDVVGDEPEAGQDAQPDVQVYDAPPPPAEVCDNGIDDDFDGLKDCADIDCVSYLKCKAEVCNGVDDNGNGLADDGPGMECVGFAGNTVPCVFSCNGAQLSGHRTCQNCKWSACVKDIQTESNCSDGIDNDCDGMKDCADMDCFTAGVCFPENCSNGKDDNANGKADCADPACATSPECVCDAPTVGSPCWTAGMVYCDPTRRCGCDYVVHNSTDNAFSCTVQEVCNGQDDNGNGLKDDGFACVQHQTTPCTTSCGSVGTQYCKTDCTLAACQNPVENCSNNADDDCDGLKDCQDPDCVNASNCKVPEICNGLDDDNDGIKDNGAGMECVGTANDVRTCTTSCGSEGHQTCSTSTCKWSSCQSPSTETKCSDSKDDDCDGYVDCQDPDCWGTLACPHDFGACQPFTPTNVAEQCTYTQEQFFMDLPLVYSACANSENDQFVLAGGYGEVKLLHKTTAWSEIQLPTPAVFGSKIVCLGAGQVYFTYNWLNVNKYHGVFARWNGTSVQVLANTELLDTMVGPVIGFSPTDIRFFAQNENSLLETWFYKWNGTSLTKMPLPNYGTKGILGADTWGTGPNDWYLVGTVHDQNPAHDEGLILHNDGTSWGRVAVPTDYPLGYNYVHGTSSCDVMVTGARQYQGQAQLLTVQRNGTTWETRLYPELKNMGNVVKTSPFKYLIPGEAITGPDPFSLGRIGTDLGNFTTVWESPFTDFDKGQIAWRIAGSSKYMILGQGIGTWLITATCQ